MILNHKKKNLENNIESDKDSFLKCILFKNILK